YDQARAEVGPHELGPGHGGVGDRRTRPSGSLGQHRRGRRSAFAEAGCESSSHRIAEPRLWTLGRTGLPVAAQRRRTVGECSPRPPVHVAQIYHQMGGPDAAAEVVRRRSGTEFDPELARLWLQNSHDLLRNVAPDSVWDQALDTEPEPHRRVGPVHLDDMCSALADFVDLASPFTSGHSAGVARLAEAAALDVGLDSDEVATVRRAGQAHDLGMVSVPNRIWITRRALNPSEWERVRLHTYHSQRILSLAAPLRSVASVTGLHHERLDGSGYHRGL